MENLIQDRGMERQRLVLRHLKRSERSISERNPWIYLAVWLCLTFLLVGPNIVDLIRRPGGLENLEPLRGPLGMLIAVIPVVLYFAYAQFKQSFSSERLYIEVSPEVIAMYENTVPTGAEARLVWTADRSELEVGVRTVSKGSKSLFVLTKKPQTREQIFWRFVGVPKWQRTLKAGNWVPDDGRSHSNPASPYGVFRLASREKMLDEMRATDLGKALIFYGYWT